MTMALCRHDLSSLTSFSARLVDLVRWGLLERVAPTSLGAPISWRLTERGRACPLPIPFPLG